MFFSVYVNAGEGDNESFDEVSVMLTITRIGNWEMPAIIKSQQAYLPVKDFFDILQIRVSASEDGDSLSGFFINPQAKYIIDKVNNRIIYEDKVYPVTPTDMLMSENILYLKSDYFGLVFGVDCIFNFRSLSIMVNTKLELPAIREMQLQQMRKNMTLLKGEKKADTTIKSRFSLFHLGMADWAIINYRQSLGTSYTRVTANIGAVVAGGEANLFLNFTSGIPFSTKQQYYRWRYVNNDNKIVRQVIAGNLFVPTIASVYGPITGVQVSNTPTTYRQSFGTYRISNRTEPGWIVELYVNNILINYTKADASGFYTFEVPLVYGATSVKLRFYGPWGEERISEQNINIPFNFLPVNQFEYNVSAGVIQDDQKSKFSRINFNYGLSARITVGTGMEYLSTVSSGKTMPFINTSMRLGNNILIAAEHSFGVRSKAVASYRLPGGLQLEVNYTKYVPGQSAIKSGLSISNNFLEDKKMTIFFPLRRKKFSGFSRLSFSQLTVPHLKYTTTELLLSGMYKAINLNLTTSAVYSDPKHPLVYSNFASTFRLPKGIRLTPQLQYEYTQNNFSMFKCEFEKNLWNKGFMILTYEKNMVYKNDNISLGVRYNFSFAQTFVSVSKSNDATSLIQSARGSILYNDKSQVLSFSNQSNVSRGGIVFMPFLDLNCNGIQDKGEPKVSGLKLRINGGMVSHNKKDTTITISGLEAYSTYFVELDKNSFDNIGWQITKPSMNIVIEPNNFRLVKVPVSVVGEVSGTVYTSGKNGLNGLARIIVNFYDKNSKLVGRTLTESDGYFNFVGLPPGTFTAQIDKNQLDKLNMDALPASIPVTIKLNKEGDIVEGLKFIVNSNK